MLIQVTEEDIRNGKKKDCKACPIVLAARRATGDTDCYASQGFIFALGRYARTPSSVSHFMFRFDSGFSVEPFSFELELIPC